MLVSVFSDFTLTRSWNRACGRRKKSCSRGRFAEIQTRSAEFLRSGLQTCRNTFSRGFKRLPGNSEAQSCAECYLWFHLVVCVAPGQVSYCPLIQSDPRGGTVLTVEAVRLAKMCYITSERCFSEEATFLRIQRWLKVES